jgi:hypothetical protein
MGAEAIAKPGHTVVTSTMAGFGHPPLTGAGFRLKAGMTVEKMAHPVVTSTTSAHE